MRNLLPIWPVVVALLSPAATEAGTLHRCDAGDGVSIYQTLPCEPHQRTIERREYETASAPSESVPGPSASRTARRGSSPPMRRAAAPAPAPARNDVAAYGCALAGNDWVQDRPCREAARPSAGARGARLAQSPRETRVDRAEICRRVRDGSYRGAPDERVADSVYRRNLMRERAGC
jgi:hypothetical protein